MWTWFRISWGNSVKTGQRGDFCLERRQSLPLCQHRTIASPSSLQRDRYNRKGRDVLVGKRNEERGSFTTSHRGSRKEDTGAALFRSCKTSEKEKDQRWIELFAEAGQKRRKRTKSSQKKNWMVWERFMKRKRGGKEHALHLLLDERKIKKRIRATYCTSFVVGRGHVQEKGHVKDHSLPDGPEVESTGKKGEGGGSPLYRHILRGRKTGPRLSHRRISEEDPQMSKRGRSGMTTHVPARHSGARKKTLLRNPSEEGDKNCIRRGPRGWFGLTRKGLYTS